MVLNLRYQICTSPQRTITGLVRISRQRWGRGKAEREEEKEAEDKEKKKRDGRVMGLATELQVEYLVIEKAQVALSAVYYRNSNPHSD